MQSAPINTFRRYVGFTLGPFIFMMFYMAPSLAPLSEAAQTTIAVAAWMIIWWISEAVQLPVTALLPIVLFPLLGVLDVQATTTAYGNPIIFLFMGGFMLALALEKWKLHLRIALSIVKLTGTNANGIILGFMLATAALSMWISNTATTVMMLPIASSVIQLLGNTYGRADKKLQNFSLAMMLGIAYSANVGGIATLIGTPPNTVLASIILENYGYEITFASWFMMGLPFTVILMACIYLMLTRVLYPNHLGSFEGSNALIREELKKLGSISRAEKVTLAIFILTALLWITRSYLNALIPGLALRDEIIAMMATIALFITPAQSVPGEAVLRWEDTRRLPWGILILFGGGLALARAMNENGIIELIGNTVADSSNWGLWIMLALLITIALFMTEVMSNVALVAVAAPVIAGIAVNLGENPLLMTIPITIASSCAFMLPMSTPPNAIVFASGHIKVAQMVRIGIILNIIAIITLLFFSQTLIPYIFDIRFGVLPDWAPGV